MVIIFLSTTLTLAMALMMLNYIISVKPCPSREKSSIFECGFDPMASSRLPFSMHFFLVALIFLIFDVEISILAPLPYTWNLVNCLSLMWTALGVLMILLAGALIEWMEGSLEWQA